MSQAARAGTLNLLKGRYAFTLAEKCVNQIGYTQPGFIMDAFGSPQINDPLGAVTYGGASDGQIVFDGNGGITLQSGRATNIMNGPDYLTTGKVPLGFGLGSALPFTCVGNYAINDGKVRIAPFTCTAVLRQPNVFGALGFVSVFSMDGWVPQNPTSMVLTDIGDSIQPVTINFPGGGSVMQQRVCTRALSLTLVSPN
jgi:hypothetical protein